jgi:hypothetical protein
LKPALSISEAVDHSRITLPAFGVAMKRESPITVGNSVVVVVGCIVVVVG